MTEEKRIDHMTYLPGMEILDSDMLDQVVAIHDSFNNEDFTAKDVRMALSKERLDRGTSWPSYRRQLPRSSKKWLKKPIWSRAATSATTFPS